MTVPKVAALRPYPGLLSLSLLGTFGLASFFFLRFLLFTIQGIYFREIPTPRRIQNRNALSGLMLSREGEAQRAAGKTLET